MGTTSHFEGTILGKTMIAMKTGASISWLGLPLLALSSAKPITQGVAARFVQNCTLSLWDANSDWFWYGAEFKQTV
jgi:hypothetical protein